MAKGPLEAQQARSRESLRKLLKATAELLEEKGLEGATIPRIARRAGLSPGTVYRRFHDKDALLRTTVMAIQDQTVEANKNALTPEFAAQHTLEQFIALIVRNNLTLLRTRPGLIRALNQYIRTHPSKAFRKKVEESGLEILRRATDFLMNYRSEIKHPNPEIAIPFSLVIMGSVLTELILNNPPSPAVAALLPLDDDHLVEELTRSTLSYLGAKK